MYNDLLLYVQNLSEQVCGVLDIPLPRVYVILSKDLGYDGGMVPAYRKTDMLIELTFPHTIDLAKDKEIVTAIVIHEHCHFKDNLEMPAKVRCASMREYLTDIGKRKADEHRTWRNTKKVAKQLGLWTKALFNEAKKCQFASELTF